MKDLEVVQSSPQYDCSSPDSVSTPHKFMYLLKGWMQEGSESIPCSPHRKKQLGYSLSPMFYFYVCILCICKKRQTDLEVCFINTALIDCFLFYQQEREKQLFRQPTLRSWDDAFAWRKPFSCTIQHRIPGSSPHTKFAPIHLGLVPFW